MATTHDTGVLAGARAGRTVAPPAPSPVPVQVAAALDGAGVLWAYLRDASEDELDVLVAPEHLARAETALRRLGYGRVPSWGRGSHRFLRSYDGTRDRWWTVDLVHELAFGRLQDLPTPVAPACLERRVVEAGTARLDDADAFWVLLLHCLLDSGGGFGRHRETVQHLARRTTGAGPVGAFLRTLTPPAVCEELHQGCALGDWDRVRRASARLRRDWLCARPGPVLRRRLVNGALQGSTKPLVAARRRGVSVVLLGPDGAGKSTTAAAFAAAYPSAAAHLYGGHYGRPLRVPERVPGLGLAVRLARQLRTDAVATGHRLRGRVAVYDRHAYDAMVRPVGATGRRARLRRRLLSRLALTPDLVVVLDASPELLFRRCGEHSVDRLAQQRRGYLDLAAALPHAVVVDAHRDPEQVRRDVTSAVWRRQVAAWSRPARHGARRVKS